MKYAVVVSMIFFLTMPYVMASGGPSFEQLYKKYSQGKPVVELIGETSKKK